MGEVLFCIGFFAWKFSVPRILVGTILFYMCNFMSFSNDFLFFNGTISFICMNFVFINDKFVDKWFQSNLFLAKKISLNQKSLHSDDFICDVTSQRWSNIIKDVGGARLVLCCVNHVNISAAFVYVLGYISAHKPYRVLRIFWLINHKCSFQKKSSEFKSVQIWFHCSQLHGMFRNSLCLVSYAACQVS